MFACVFLINGCISFVLLQITFALSFKTFRKNFGDVVFVFDNKSPLKSAAPSVVVVLCCESTQCFGWLHKTNFDV